MTLLFHKVVVKTQALCVKYHYCYLRMYIFLPFEFEK